MIWRFNDEEFNSVPFIGEDENYPVSVKFR